MFTYEPGNLVQGLPPLQPVARLASTVVPSCQKELGLYRQTDAELASASALWRVWYQSDD